MNDCQLCILEKIEPQLILTRCKDCGVPMLISLEHRKDFTDEEKELIEQLGVGVRYKKRKIKSHAHAHLEGIR